MTIKKAILIMSSIILIFVFSGCSNSDTPKKPKVNKQLVVVSYGGAHQKAQSSAYFKPFAEKYNVDILEETWSGDLGVIKAMVETGNVTWDVVDVEAYMVYQGARQKLYERLSYSGINKNDILPQAMHEYGIATCFWSTVIAFNTKLQSSQIQQLNWARFWDSKLLPGRRALRRDPVGNLEAALMADGVPKSQIYPIDADLAFKSLDKIKQDISIWWEAGEQPADLLSKNEVLISSAWNGRIQNAALNGRPVDITWEGGILSSDWWVIPRGSKNKELAEEFIAFASAAEPQAEYSKLIPYGPVNRVALTKLPPERLRDLPTSEENLSKQLFLNNAWWVENKDRILERWKNWLLE